MVGGGKVGMEFPVIALAARMTRWAVGGRQSLTLCLFFRLAMGGDDGTERFGGMQPGRHVSKDPHETQVVL